MPRVLRIINRLNIGGPTFNASYLSRYLPPPFETLLVAGMKEDSEASSSFIPESLGLEPHYVQHMYRAINPVNDFRAYRELRDLIRDYRPDIVHTHAAKPGALGRLAAIREGVPVVLHTFHGHVFHSYFGRAKTEFFLRVERYLAARSSGIIAISRVQAQELRDQFKVAPSDKVFTIPLGFDLQRFRTDRDTKRAAFREAYGIDDNVVTVGIIGRLVPVKHHTLFLRAWKRALDTIGTPAKAFIIGDGESRAAIEQTCVDLGLTLSTPERPDPSASVIFTSWITDVERAYAGLDIVALSSLNEGTPVSLIEAQASAKPIVSTRVGGIEDIVKPGESALLVGRHDETGFAEALSRLIDDPDLRTQMGSSAEEESHRKFSYTRLVDDVEALYRRLLSDKGLPCD